LAFPPPTKWSWTKWLRRSESEEFLRKRQKDLEVHTTASKKTLANSLRGGRGL